MRIAALLPDERRKFDVGTFRVVTRRGVRIPIGKSRSFGEVTISAITLAVEAPGTYSVGYVQNRAMPIFELKTYRGCNGVAGVISHMPKIYLGFRSI